ncbi:TPA: hypothetical protein MF110_04425 [Klebsiella pneumoniae]|uniref:hypothetical protein n=1 Tax=Klebsiella pneumoniae TaxID=573 RepID=UPI0011428942|nr:hypothetical protein [Klebsiella pneumoniae]TYY40304.1 hypothetical protein FCH00_027905 [Klebsiella pneumoniae]HBX0755960.1 hypothetical protein [Klebsiella pneumoniae]
MMFEKKDYDKEFLNINKRSKKHTCLYSECLDKTIYSHTISKSISIEKISENGHVKNFSPTRYRCEKIPKMSDIGVNDATAFNGFCHHHDRIFNDIDEKEISNLRDLYLQIYRSISCVYYYEQLGDVLYPDIDIDKAVKIILDGQNTKDEIDITQGKLYEMKELLRDEIRRLNKIKNNELNEMKGEINRVRNYFLNNIYELDERKYVNRKLNEKGTELQTIKFKDFDYALFYYISDFQIPVAINTMHNLNYNGCAFLFFYIVIPYEGSNIIIGVMKNNLPPEYYDKIINLIDNAFKNRLSVLNFIETLVISSPDDTYFKPCVINNMKKEKLDFILNDFMFLHEFLSFDKYFSEYDVSIFDELRTSLISEGVDCFNENELDKVHSLPQRESIEVRKNKMMGKIMKENITIKSLKK